MRVPGFPAQLFLVHPANEYSGAFHAIDRWHHNDISAKIATSLHNNRDVIAQNSHRHFREYTHRHSREYTHRHSREYTHRHSREGGNPVTSLPSADLAVLSTGGCLALSTLYPPCLPGSFPFPGLHRRTVYRLVCLPWSMPRTVSPCTVALPGFPPSWR